MKISEKTTVEEAMKKSPEAARVFRKYKLDCPDCRGAGQDTIAMVALNNGLDLKVLLQDLNDASMK